MTDERNSEDAFFAGRGAPPAPLPPEPPRRRSSPLLSRSPVFAVLVLGVSGWLLWSLWADVAFFFASQEPLDLGGPGAYRLESARENRLAQIRGELVELVPVTERRTGAARTVGRIAGTNLLVDRPGRGGPPVFEGRILPARARGDYAEVAAVMRARGAPLGDRWLVLRDGDRPRRRWGPVVGAALLLAVIALNARALLTLIAPPTQRKR
jgi:hypothetical protein